MAFCEIGSIMEIPVEPVFLALFYNHTLVVSENYLIDIESSLLYDIRWKNVNSGTFQLLI